MWLGIANSTFSLVLLCFLLLQQGRIGVRTKLNSHILALSKQVVKQQCNSLILIPKQGGACRFGRIPYFGLFDQRNGYRSLACG